RQIVAINKIDLSQVRENLPEIARWFEERGLRPFPISAATGEGIAPLLDEIARHLWGKSDET
ncbi:MAG TPA: GTPase ObgE, partial [Geobacteraceae bacterium]|nr:GTPase ObgE [Geobacteraceae bacterium]